MRCCRVVCRRVHPSAVAECGRKAFRLDRGTHVRALAGREPTFRPATALAGLSCQAVVRAGLAPRRWITMPRVESWRQSRQFIFEFRNKSPSTKPKSGRPATWAATTQQA